MSIHLSMPLYFYALSIDFYSTLKKWSSGQFFNSNSEVPDADFFNTLNFAYFASSTMLPSSETRAKASLNELCLYVGSYDQV